MKYYSKRYEEQVEMQDFDDLKEYVAGRSGDIHLVVSRFWRRFRARTIDNRPLWLIINPWREIRRLRAFNNAMRHEELQSARNALALYEENEVLRRYKLLLDGEMAQFVPVDEHVRVKKDLEATKQKLCRVSAALDAQNEAWMKDYDLSKREKYDLSKREK